MKKIFIGVFSLVALILFNQSCQKIDTTNLGANLIPVVDNVNTFDTTFDVITDVNMLEDSTGVTYVDNHAVGVIEDPEFGRTTANMYFEMLPVNSGVPFLNPDSINGKIDSVVLSLSYKSLYGDSNAVENFRVYEISQSAVLKDSLVAVTGGDIPVAGPISPDFSVQFTTLNDPKNVKPGKDTVRAVANVLRIPLDLSLGHRLVNYDTTVYKTDSSFRTYFKGIAIKADSISSPFKKALAYFDIGSADTRLIVYYRTVTNGAPDTTYTEFAFNSTRSGRRNANILRRNINGTNYLSNLANTSKNQDNLYIQSTPGSYASIHIPGLSSMSNRVIHSAELIVPRIHAAEENFLLPPTLFLDVMDSTTSEPRFITVPNDFLGDITTGSYNVATFGGILKNEMYRFDLSRYVQGIVTRLEPSYTLRLYAPYYTFTRYVTPNVRPISVVTSKVPFLVNSQIGAGRVIVAGGSHISDKMRLRIIYSKI